MQVAINPVSTRRYPAVPRLKNLGPSKPSFAAAEINAYIAIRDGLLAEAEQVPTAAKLDALELANEFVAGCLKPSRAPYEAQALPEQDAARERLRCQAVANRVVRLRAATR